MSPRVSVIIPYYEGEKWLPLSAASVLGQTGVDLELIVVDDGSAVSAGPVISRLGDDRARLIRLPHTGKGAAMNAGIRAAAADIVCFLDQDDRMLPGRLERQAAALAADPGANAVYSDYERVDEGGRRIDIFISRQAESREMLHAMAYGTGLISMQTMAIRKSRLESLGGFSEDPALTGLDDADFFVRLICSGAVIRYVPGIAGQWVSHADNYSKGHDFFAARLRLLSRLQQLEKEYPPLRRELKYFKAHAFYMRGLYLLESGMSAEAAGEFLRALCAHPASLDTAYLFCKSLALAALTPLTSKK